MRIILGIDPGSRITGYGVIQTDGIRHRYVCSGCIKAMQGQFAERLGQIFAGIRTVIATYQPVEVAIEQVFIHRNISSAMKLGHARGVLIVAAAMEAIPVAEYSARQVKQSVVGYGAAKKEQVQHMVKTLLQLSGTPQADAADALAVALAHANYHTIGRSK